jgi:hypothetical protein
VNDTNALRAVAPNALVAELAVEIEGGTVVRPRRHLEPRRGRFALMQRLHQGLRDATPEVRGTDRETIDVDDIPRSDVAEETSKLSTSAPPEDRQAEVDDVLDLLHQRRELVEADQVRLDGVGRPLQIADAPRDHTIAVVEDDNSHTRSIAAGRCRDRSTPSLWCGRATELRSVRDARLRA